MSERPDVIGWAVAWLAIVSLSVVFLGSAIKMARALDIDPEKPDWVMVVGCASNPYPKRPHKDDTAEEYRNKLDRFWEIRDCRIMLLARDAGWKAAGGGTNPYPPQPMLRPGDYGR